MLLIRHGDSYSKSDGVYAGPRACRGLTELGREQTLWLRERLVANAVKPEAVYRESVEASLIAFGSLPLHRDFDVEIRNTSITEWVTEDDPAAPWDPEDQRRLPARWRLSRFNDCAHLEG